MRGVPYTPTNPASGGYLGTGAVTGQVIALPPALPGQENFTTVQLVFGADPGAYVFQLLGSLDGVTFTALTTNELSKTTVNAGVKLATNVPFIRLDQTSKANSVTGTAQLMVN